MEAISRRKDPHLEEQDNTKQLQKRILSGLVIGISAGGAILMGGWIFTVAVAAAAFIAAWEYFELVKGVGNATGVSLPQHVSGVCSFLCALMPIWTLYCGQVDIPLTFAACIMVIALLLQRGDPCFDQLTSAFFGLFYCGYLPSFWVKLRCGLTVPALNTKIGYNWPFLLGGLAHWTVGLVATLLTVSSIIAADTYAFLGGKAFGRTPLTNISPKKTLEGAVLGLASCIATSIVLFKILCWPRSLLRRHIRQSRQLHLHWCSCIFFYQHSSSLWCLIVKACLCFVGRSYPEKTPFPWPPLLCG